MIKFSYYPQEVINSKVLTSEECDLWLKIFANRCAGGYCKLTNKDLAEKLGWSERTVQYHLSNLIKKKYAGVFMKDLRNGRRIYVNIPGEPKLYEAEPTNEDLAKMSDELCDSMRKAVVLGDTNFDALVSAIKTSNYLEGVDDSNSQFALTLDQVRFLGLLMIYFPEKKIDCQLATYPEDIDFEKLFDRILHSELLPKGNLSLKWLLEHREEILQGNYGSVDVDPSRFDIQTGTWQKRRSQNFNGRTYTREEINALYDDLDTLEI